MPEKIKKNKIKINKLNFYYGEKLAIDNLNLRIPANKIMSIIGPANSGITTLLRTLNRLCDLTPDVNIQGDVLLDGQSIFSVNTSITELRRRVGIVFDVPTPLPMSIYENITYGPRLAGKRNKKALFEIAERALTQAALWEEVKDRLKIPAMSLSGGQQQRLCLARVLALEPEVVLLDRPCSGLDPISTAKIEESLVELKKQFTIIISPHNVQQAARISDRVALMKMGKLIEEGTNLEIFSTPKAEITSNYIRGRFGDW
jgi:phosphate transport system ATP-binding protein